MQSNLWMSMASSELRNLTLEWARIALTGKLLDEKETVEILNQIQISTPSTAINSAYQKA